MAKDDLKLSSAKRSYKQASDVGNRQEEARWANLIGDILKNRGEYVEALKWLRIDYELSMKYLPEKQLLPTCQSLGEMYLRLQEYKEAKVYQKKHLELAKDSGDIVEQQRASTQLGRTYHEMFLKSEDDHSSRRNAKKYFNLAMNLARNLKENGAVNESSSFLKEYIDAYNNVGMLQMDLDNYDEAEKTLLEGLRICDEEEVVENDDGRSRLHHHLGYLYTQLRKWEKAKEHIQKDIKICQNIGHRQGEAKGYINLGELYYQDQRFEDTKLCYERALKIAKSMEDEDALVNQIQENIKIVDIAMGVLADMGKQEQNLKKLTRNTGTAIAKGKPDKRKCLLQQIKCLDTLIENSSQIFAWRKHQKFAKMKKKIASDLGDKEMLSDSLLAIGESYQKLRIFQKALKWYRKSWDTSKSVRNLEGQALAKINIGDVLDSQGDWNGALEAFEEGYRIAVQSKVRHVQISALENMHYSYMIRFDNVEEARKLQLKIQEVKKSQDANHEEEYPLSECSETDTEGYDRPSNEHNSPEFSDCSSIRSKSLNNTEDDPTLSAFLRPRKTLSKQKVAQAERPIINLTENSPKSMSNSTDKQKAFSGRKRARLVISDDESDGGHEPNYSREKRHNPAENVAISYDSRKNDGESEFVGGVQASSHRIASKYIHSVTTPTDHEESNCSHKLGSPKAAVRDDTYFRSFGLKEVNDASNFATIGSKVDGDNNSNNFLQNLNPADFSADNLWRNIPIRIDDKVIHLDALSCIVGEMLSIERMKSEVACLYYLQQSDEKRSKGLLPIIRHMVCGGKVLESLEPATLKDYIWEKGWIEVNIDGWIQKRLIKLYIDWCKKLSEAPNFKLLKKLYNLEVSEDEILGSECELQDISVAPLLNALNENKAIALLDLSHNLLGNETMKKLGQIFVSSSQKYGGLTLDLHCNRFGSTALYEICECPVLFARLEVLNISGNRLTDGCGSYLSTILGSCKALYSLNIERCSITSKTIQKVAEAIDPGSVLSHLSIAHNPISGNAMINLLSKLAALKRFSDLNLGGIKLSKSVSDSLCQLMQTSCMSSLIVGNTNIGPDVALELVKALSVGPQELMTLDLSFCGITSCYTERLCTNISLIGGILELNLGGNPIRQQGVDALVSLLMSPECSLKDLVLNKCNLGLGGIIKIVHALTENQVLEELNLEENTDSEKDNTLEYDLTVQGRLKSLQAEVESSDINPSSCSLKQLEVTHQEKEECIVNFEIELEVADSEEDLPTTGKPVLSVGNEDSCTSFCQKNTPFQGSQFIEELSFSIASAKHLKLLVLSNNGFTADVTETLYTSWSSSSGRGLARRHIKDKTVHFSVEGKSCCGVKACCKRG
ncbi:hypothetical protein MKW94_020017 [Papaver nudicaule]|uniref:Protein TONSOKU n=1 Tax=Papaver nudicaule TaxID=74823 RepID=A0AA42AZU8_PAPNU|nr:hypothetical protein [Papaver nudicaule]